MLSEVSQTQKGEHHMISHVEPKRVKFMKQRVSGSYQGQAAGEMSRCRSTEFQSSRTNVVWRSTV